jgi:D-serine deaminase-like pyridoxal phosphate-dependent protein
MTLDELDTPCLVLDRKILQGNLDRMHALVRARGIAFRPHLKTAKSAAVARLALQGEAGGLTVSTLAEAEYFAGHGFRDLTLAAGITSVKLDRVADLAHQGIGVTVITDDADTAAAIGANPAPFRALVEVDSGENRGGVTAESGALLIVARALGGKLAGILTHGGHSYLGRTVDDMKRIAEEERWAAVRAATRLREAGLPCEVVSVGSTPTAVHGERWDGVTELRAGVYMFQDLFQAAIHSCTQDDIALTVLSSVIGRRPGENTILLDAGALALSKDRSTERTAHDAGFGLIRGLDGTSKYGECRIERVYQEHGIAVGTAPLPFDQLQVGARVRVVPNHACLTAAAYDRYHVVDGGDAIVDVWDRINGW